MYTFKKRVGLAARGSDEPTDALGGVSVDFNLGWFDSVVGNKEVFILQDTGPRGRLIACERSTPRGARWVGYSLPEKD